MSAPSLLIGSELALYREVLPRVRSRHPDAWFLGEVIHGDYAQVGLAVQSECHERLVREWLDSQAAGGILVYDEGEDTYTWSLAKAGQQTRMRFTTNNAAARCVTWMAVTAVPSGTVVPTGVQVGSGVKAGATYRITIQGSATQTGNDLDIMIKGRGYLQVTLPSGQVSFSSWSMMISSRSAAARSSSCSARPARTGDRTSSSSSSTASLTRRRPTAASRTAR